MRKKWCQSELYSPDWLMTWRQFAWAAPQSMQSEIVHVNPPKGGLRPRPRHTPQCIRTMKKALKCGQSLSFCLHFSPSFKVWRALCCCGIVRGRCRQLGECVLRVLCSHVIFLEQLVWHKILDVTKQSFYFCIIKLSKYLKKSDIIVMANSPLTA